MINTGTLQISQDILMLIAEIEQFKGAWQALGRLAPDRLAALRRIATIDSIGSSIRIEGSHLSDQEVEHLLSSLPSKSFVTRDEQEAAGYAAVLELVLQSWPGITITETHIKRLHRDLLQYSTKDEHHRGHYKTTHDSITAVDQSGRQSSIVVATATPFDTPRLLKELLEFVNESYATKTLHPLLIIGIFVVVLLEIRPFQAGNERLSRILSTLLLLRAGYAYVPYSSLESVIEQSKESYYRALRQTQSTIRTATPNWQPWITFFLRALHKQVKLLAAKVEHEQIVLSTLPELSIQILEYAREHGRVTIGDTIKFTDINRNTLKKHFHQLVDKEYLVLHGSGRGAWYSLA